MQRSDTNDSGLDDILGAYGDSPVKSRTQAPTPPASSPTRYRNPQLPPPRAESMKRTQTDQSTASSSSGFDVLPTLDRRNDPSLSRSQGSSKTERPSHPSRSKSGNSLDLIDRLDISGLYGGGGELSFSIIQSLSVVLSVNELPRLDASRRSLCGCFDNSKPRYSSPNRRFRPLSFLSRRTETFPST